MLELPFQPLCRTDCCGLCAECGANLNDDPDHGHAAESRPTMGCACAALRVETAKLTM